MTRLACLVAGTSLALALCSIEGSAHPTVAGVTWNGTVATLLERRCAACHTGNDAVLPRLDDYDAARAAAQDIKQAVLTRRMPRWDAINSAGQFANDRSLTPYEAGLIADWADEGAPRGTAASVRHHHASQLIATPDLQLHVASRHLIREAEYTFDLPTGLDDERWIRGWAFEPGNRPLVRSAVISLSSGVTLGTWVPGESATFLPDGVAARLPAGAAIRLTVHYTQPEGPAVDASAVGLYFARSPQVEVHHLDLRCGATVIPQSIRALAIRPALETAGASLQAVARPPRADHEVLGSFKNYSADFPDTYWYRTPILLERGTSIELTAAHGGCAGELEYVAGGLAPMRALASHTAPVDADDEADEGTASGYACPMHPDVHAELPGACPVCQMTLVPIGPRVDGAYALEVRTSTTPSGDRTLRLVVTDPVEQRIVRSFENVHERPFHLFIVSEDLAQFTHEHPVAQPDGSLVLRAAPIKAGPYRVFADFLPTGGTPQLLQGAVFAGATPRAASSRPSGLAPDLRDKTDRDVRAHIDIESGDLVAGKPGLIDFVLSDPVTGEPVSDLEPYLGAWGHMFIVSADLADAVHSHPITVLKASGGPRIVFSQRFPRPGSYRLWTQFQRHGQVATVSFTVAVK